MHLSSTFLNTGITEETFQQSEKKDSSDKYGRVQLVCMKVQVRNSLVPPLEYSQD